MLVENWMDKSVITVNANDSMLDAINLLKQNDIRMLPVMKKDKLVGIITDRDLKRASASDATTLEVHELLFLLSKIKAEEIMSKDPITVPPDLTVEETAEILLMNKISGVPVVDHDGQIIGSITQAELFKVLVSMTGLSKRGCVFAFQLKDQPGSIKEVTDIIRKYNGRMVSILSSYDHVPEGFRRVYIRMYGVNRLNLQQLKKRLREKATMLYMVDHRENRREVY